MKTVIYSEPSVSNSAELRMFYTFGLLMIIIPLFLVEGFVPENGFDEATSLAFDFNLIGWIALLVYFFHNWVLRSYQAYSRSKDVRAQGEPVTATILKTSSFSMLMFTGTALWVEFTNRSETKVVANIYAYGNNDGASEYSPGSLVTVYMNRESSLPPVVLANAGQSLLPVYLNLLWFSVTAVLVVGFNMYLYGSLPGFSGVPHVGVVGYFAFIPYSFVLVFFLIRKFFGGVTSADSARLLLDGKQAVAHIVEKHQTGTFVNNQPQIKFEIRFKDAAGNEIEGSFKKIVELTSLHMLSKETANIIYLPENPSAVMFLDF